MRTFAGIAGFGLDGQVALGRAEQWQARQPGRSALREYGTIANRPAAMEKLVRKLARVATACSDSLCERPR